MHVVFLFFFFFANECDTVSFQIYRRYHSTNITQTFLKRELSSEINVTMSTILDVTEERQAYRTQAAGLNAELSAAVHDNQQAPHPMLEELMEQLQTWKSRWLSWCDANVKVVAQFDATYTHPEPVGYTTKTLDSEVGAALDTEWVGLYGPVDPQRLESMVDAVDDVYRGIIHPQKRADSQFKLKSFVAKAFPLGDENSVEGMFDLHDLQHADPLALLRAEFTRSLHRLSVMEAQLAQTLEERENSLRTEDVKGAEERTGEAIAMMRQLLAAAYTRHRDSLLAEVDVAQYHENVRATKVAVTERLTTIQQQNTQVKTTASNDLQLLNVFVESFEEEARDKLDQYQQRTTKFKGAMTDNTKQMNILFDQVLQSLQQLATLSTFREDLVTQHTTDTTLELLRQEHQKELTAAASSRKEELQRIIQNTTSALDYCSNVQNYLEQADEYIQKLQFPVKLTKIQNEEALRSYDVYRRYVLLANSALLKKEQRLENVRRLLRSTEFQIANAVETFDTDLPLYRQQLTTLNSTELLLSNDAQKLSDELAEETERWLHMEAFLDERRVDFDPPSLLVQELKRDLLVSHVEAVDELTNKEQKLLDGEKANIRKMLNAVEAAKEAFRDRKVTSPVLMNH
ncbi:paraflagellar rod protein, putative [Bodo saltans]|uniref:Paraflagellar rod protein, putative n=1 Tax=Bodo saltans TaxID=75058 RepID=A0A0S4IM34_BODSA|nr:paraflagellar rod protein, putative [Bodo saltans]|eukprot:CUE72815.1 paraflagellar rod protein, putative [Bodo saltans]